MTTFTIDQAGLPPGAAGRARTDGRADGSLVTLTHNGPGSTSFSLLWTPPGDASAVATLAPTGNPKVWTFAPTPGLPGTYLVELVENIGLPTESRLTLAFGVRTPNLGLLIPAFGERGADNNDDNDPDGPAIAGWWRAMARLINKVDDLFGPIRVTWFHRDSGGALTFRTHRTFAAALAESYPIGFASTAVVDVEPTFGPDDPGPYTLDDVVHYVIRSAAGRGAVRLPELVVPDGRLTVEGCAIVQPITGIGLVGTSEVALRECLVAASLSNLEALEARECAIGASVVLGTAAPGATFDRCAFAPGVTITSNAAGGGVLTFVDCSFSAPAAGAIHFAGGPGVVRMDARSNFLWIAAGGTIINGSLIVEA